MQQQFQCLADFSVLSLLCRLYCLQSSAYASIVQHKVVCTHAQPGNLNVSACFHHALIQSAMALAEYNILFMESEKCLFEKLAYSVAVCAGGAHVSVKQQCR